MTSTTSPMTTSSVFVSGLINRSAHNIFACGGFASIDAAHFAISANSTGLILGVRSRVGGDFMRSNHRLECHDAA
jgi:hypothetical protein